MSVGLLTLPTNGRAAARTFFLVSDLQSGLYVLEAPWTRKDTRTH